MEKLPNHLKKYIVVQEENQYTSLDHACWRYILRQLKSYLAVHGHPSYLEGLEKTGIEVERIPLISEISRKLEEFGWRALPVSGFIPPAAFMEMQALGLLPIASAMRSIDHLSYTPAPDIVHEAAGHAPLLYNPEYAAYLRKYAEVAKKAILSKEDLELYRRIRILSDLKENPASTRAEIEEAEIALADYAKSMSHNSEGTFLSRMNWWTAEYGLIGALDDPKIFGAGLLSSTGEAKHCLSNKVKKLPLTLDCLNYSYDITEPQPQLFVTPDFKTLGLVLEQMASKMAFRLGGKESVQKIIQAESVNSIELNSGIQVSGICSDLITNAQDEIVYLKWRGPCQLSYVHQELENQGTSQHPEGFGMPLGRWEMIGDRCPSSLTETELTNFGLKIGQTLNLKFVSGLLVSGKIKSFVRKDGKLILMTWTSCEVKWKDKILFEKTWGDFDMPVGSSIPSVFGGPADRMAFGEVEDFVALRVPPPAPSAEDQLRQSQYQKVREIRNEKVVGQALETQLKALFENHKKSFPNDWLFYLECYELAFNRTHALPFKEELLHHLKQIQKDHPKVKKEIDDGLSLAHQIKI